MEWKLKVLETGGEAVFAARNAIDGIYENSSHGEWPYQSWGINRDPNACLTLCDLKKAEGPLPRADADRSVGCGSPIVKTPVPNIARNRRFLFYCLPNKRLASSSERTPCSVMHRITWRIR